MLLTCPAKGRSWLCCAAVEHFVELPSSELVDQPYTRQVREALFISVVERFQSVLYNFVDCLGASCRGRGS